ncbi:MAG TPA: (Fe-S)-binding protein, partial [bacterium]|nr:(Fe-S)-binding protein [bacterium]
NPFGLPAGERGSWISEDVVKRKADVAYFAGCAVSYSQNRMAKAALRILDGAGIEYTTLGNDERCCGDPLLRMGLKDQAETMMEENRSNLQAKGVKTVFTSCAGCAKSLKHSLGQDFEVYHVTEYLNKLASEGKIEFEKPFAKRVTYMDGCDLGRHAGVYESPRELLRHIPDIELVEMQQNRNLAVCCGGPFVAAYPELAKKFAANRIKDALAVGADTIVVACPTCLLNLKEGAKSLDGAKVDIQEVVSLVQRSVKGK